MSKNYNITRVIASHRITRIIIETYNARWHQNHQHHHSEDSNRKKSQQFQTYRIARGRMRNASNAHAH